MTQRSITKSIRRYLIGKKQKFVFLKANADLISFPEIKKTGIYIHVPFCKSLCPYCPYNRVRFEQHFVKPFLGAVLEEIELYYKKFGRIEITSIYIGGGTPTNIIDELGDILEAIKERFNVTGDICIETSVSDANKSVVEKLKKYGVSLISIGIQSFSDKYLRLLGRNYHAKDIKPAIKIIKDANFKSVNIDLMFALPGQSLEDVMADLKEAVKLGVDQITLYPLFNFPYSSVGKFLKLEKIKMPNLFTRRKMYYAAYDFLIKKGYKRVSVWGFEKGGSPRYSSVTRSFYIGLGPGAASSFSSMFYFNTFSIPEYIKTLYKQKLPISLKMDVTPKLFNCYWFYWKLYDTYFSKQQIIDVFGKDKKIFRTIRLFQFLRLLEKKDSEFALTQKGAFWIHLAQNYFMLDYIDKVWTRSMKEPWPTRIEI